MIDELRALKQIKERFGGNSNGIEIGIGDDAAAVSTNPENYLLSTTDSQVEGVHFHKDTISPRELGRKSVAVSVSDICAMGGIPKYILATAGFSDNEDQVYLDSFMKGFKDAEQEFGVKLIGGNLTVAGKLFVDITVLGEVEKGNVVRREGAFNGDLIFVSGTLGDSSLGLKILDQSNDYSNGESFLVDRHNSPSPRLELGSELAKRKLVNSMIDVSDGLLLDLSRITINSDLGAEIELENIPLSDEYRKNVTEFADNKYEFALGGGEDYELLFTAPKSKKQEIFNLSSELELLITEIGNVTGDKKINIINLDGTKKEIEKRGFVHFAK